MWEVVGADRVCSFCGSLHPADLEAILDRCIETGEVQISHSTKGYKVYINRPEIQNASEGAIKYYIWHALLDTEDVKRVQGKLNRAIKLTRNRLLAQLGRSSNEEN
jgi:hypothetical protein